MPAINDIGSSSADKKSSTLVSSNPVSSIENTNVDVREKFRDGGKVSTDEFEKYYNIIKDRCVKFDVNDDGIDELILLDSEQFVGEFQIIISIFSTENGMVTRRFHDDVEMGRGSFISESSKLVDYYYTYGTFCFNSYDDYKFNEDWKPERSSSLEIYDIYSVEELPNDWVEENPEMSEAGVYRFIINYEKNESGELIEKKEKVSQEEFEKAFEEVIGVPFSQMPPEWYKSPDKATQNK